MTENIDLVCSGSEADFTNEVSIGLKEGNSIDHNNYKNPVRGSSEFCT